MGLDGNDVYRQASLGALGDCLDRLDASGADRELIEITKRALSAKVDDRWCNAGECATALSSYLNSVQQRLKSAELAQAKAQTTRKLSVAIAALMLLIAVGSAIAAGRFRQQRQIQANLARSETHAPVHRG